MIIAARANEAILCAEGMDMRRWVVAVAALVVTSVFLKKSWYDKLEKDVESKPEVVNDAQRSGIECQPEA